MRKHLYLIPVLSCLLGLLWACTPSADKADVLLVHAGECMDCLLYTSDAADE